MQWNQTLSSETQLIYAPSTFSYGDNLLIVLLSCLFWRFVVMSNASPQKTRDNLT